MWILTKGMLITILGLFKTISFESDPEHPFVFGSVLFMGTWISMMIACINGSGIPILVRSGFLLM